MSPILLLLLIPIAVVLTWLLLSKKHIAAAQKMSTELEVLRGACEQYKGREKELQQSALAAQQNLQAAMAAEAAARAHLESALSRQQEMLKEEQSNIRTIAVLRETLNERQESLARQQAALEQQALRFSEQQAFLEQTKAEMEREFRLIAAASLERQGGQLAGQQQERLSHTLEPFRVQLEAFRKQVDDRFGAEAESRATLKGELNKMLELNQTISQQTHNLTQALSRQSRQQGAYGEDVLETILSNAGMLEGEHYYRQFSTRNEDGQRIRPDIIIRRPEGLSIVVDSKVSLTHYLQYCEPGITAETEQHFRKEVYGSFKAHIDGLGAKKYDTIEGTADFVLLFTPVENAYTVATNHDPNLRAYAFAKNVFVVTPSSLLLVVKMISDLWQKDRMKRGVQEMADQARKVYEKASLFVSSFESVGKSLDRAKADWEQAAIRMQGHGSLLSQGKKLEKMLGTMTAKQLPERLGDEVVSHES
jgi:DNA recombination protein RmuC